MSTIEDQPTIRRLLHLGGLVGSLTTLGFGGLFFAFDEDLAAWSTVTLAVATLALWRVVIVGRLASRVAVVMVLFAVVAMANHILVHVSLGGFARSGGYLFGGVVMTLMVGLALPRSATYTIALVYVAAAVLLGVNEPALSSSRAGPPLELTVVLFVAVFTGALCMLVPMFAYFLGQLATERARAEALLLNILPVTVAQRLKTNPGLIADRHEHCTILFADLVDFTAHSKDKNPAQVVHELDTIFSRFDALVLEHRAEKIKTIGDGYMAACGLPDSDPDHVEHACALGLAMIAAMPALNAELGTRLDLRVGINTGSAVAGIVGATKYAYDVWGDTVNLASRLESNGPPGVVTASATVAISLEDRYRFERLGTKDLKGQGKTTLYALIGPS